MTGAALPRSSTLPGAPGPRGPSGGKVACSGCQAPLDPLRAGHVAIFSAQFHFFCNRAVCRQRFLGQPPIALPAPPKDERPRALDSLLPPVRPALESAPADEMPPRVVVDEDKEILEPVPVGAAPAEPDEGAATERREVGLLLVALGLIAGVLSMALELAESTKLVDVSRVVLLTVGSAALFGRAVTQRADGARPHWLVVISATLLATITATWALVAGGEAVARACFLGGTVLTVASLDLWLVGLASRSIEHGRRALEQRLDVMARRVGNEQTPISKEVVYDVRVGDHVLVEAGETVPVDLEIVEGEVEVLPWVGSAARVRRKAGDTVVAGSRVTQGQLRGVCLQIGNERALARPILAEARRADIHSQLPRLSRRIAERGAPIVALAAGGVFAALGWAPLETAMVVVAAYAAFGNVAVGSLAAASVMNGVRAALARGVVYHDAAAWDACSRVTAAVFCARGTLLRGEPELVEVEMFDRRGAGEAELLSLASGALAGARDPVALAVRRAAQARGIEPDAVRNARPTAGGGMTAAAATGESLCIGTRALLLDRGISVAAAEQRIYELEAAGRTVVLLARAGRLLGLMALQDGLRSGARAAVQHLLDAKVEPVLMSSDTRETCEALGRALDIDHLRPEVHDEERALAVQRIRDTGASVAVLGHIPYDEDALLAADASVALNAAGRGRDDLSVSLVGDDVRDAALALALAHRTRSAAVTALGLVLAPAGLGVLSVTLGVLPPEYAPLAQMLGAIAATWHIRAGELR